MWPIVIYMSMRRKTTDAASLFFSLGVSVSRSRASSPGAVCFETPSSRLEAPYPAFSTALMISEEDAVPSTLMEFVRRLTAQEETPGTSETAFSTLAWHAAQLMPVT